MCGYDTKEQVDAAAGYETASEEEKDYASVLANAPFHSYRGECTYCGHCKMCIRDSFKRDARGDEDQLLR